ncbi:hypothetical protein Y1Q_0023873 [Alligator mississippiensis]|uniref:Uncharacterized protein n=1 Tax=Alligator mississippiensis TaxID=8496 RepID=A0A151MKI5_ALLMI|nr:hypothetical protein Y1Q_0023873 [Alligator mississippiensis]
MWSKPEVMEKAIQAQQEAQTTSPSLQSEELKPEEASLMYLCHLWTADRVETGTAEMPLAAMLAEYPEFAQSLSLTPLSFLYQCLKLY